MKKIFILIMTGLLTAGSVFADVKSGTTGSLTWSYDTDTKVLTISGAGEIPSYDADTPPWNSFRSEIEEVVIASGVTTIGKKAFDSCTNLTSVTLPESITRIDARGFSDCSSLVAITFPESEELITIGMWAFSNCSSLTSLVIPENTTAIGYDCFSGCTALKTLIYNSVGNRNYSDGCPGWTSITTLTIGDKVEQIKPYGTFWGCTELTEITVNAVKPPVMVSTFRDTNHDIPVYIPYGSLEAYRSDMYWNKFTNLIEQPSSGVAENTWQEITIFVQGGEITITGIDSPDVSVYDVNGKVVASGAMNRIAVPQAGMYIVRVAGETVKVICNNMK